MLIVSANSLASRSHYYEFALVVENGAWKIRSASWLRTEQPAGEDPAAAQPGQYDYSNIATVLDRALRQDQEYSPLIVGAVAVAGNYAAAYALPYPGNKQFAFLRQAPGAGWEVVLVTGAPTAEQLARAGIPRTLLVAGDRDAGDRRHRAGALQQLGLRRRRRLGQRRGHRGGLCARPCTAARPVTWRSSCSRRRAAGSS